MDIKELDKRQLILLTLLITFVVSIGTGIVTVSLMKQMPQKIPQTINNVIQRTIEKVTTVEVPSTTKTSDVNNNNTTNTKESLGLFADSGDALVSIYSKNIIQDTPTTTTVDGTETTSTKQQDPIGQGVIVSDIGLILVESSILNGDDVYKVILGSTDFDASVLKKFNNGFTILKISTVTDKTIESTNTETVSQ